MGSRLGRLVPDAGTPIYIGPLAVTLADVLAADGVVAASANYNHAEQGIGFTAVTPGIAGNAIAILSDVQPSVGALTVSVDGTTITLHLRTDSDSTILSTLLEVANAVNGDEAAAALVTATGVLAAETYEAGDLYLSSGESSLVVASLTAGSVIWDAQEFFPEAWDANTVLIARVGVGSVSIFYDGDPPTDTADDTGTEGVAVAQTDAVFNTARRLRLTEDSDLAIHATCDAGAVPTQGEMLFYAEIIAPS